MSIYHSIKTVQKTSESFVKFDLEASKSSQCQGQTDFNNSQTRKQKRQEKENFNPQKSQEIVFVQPSPTLSEQVSSNYGVLKYITINTKTIIHYFFLPRKLNQISEKVLKLRV